jgi:ABC-type uncharacterized transport system permease subunit
MIDIVLGLIAPTLMAATPLITAAMGELLAQRAGVMNLGIEGCILMGAAVGFAVTALGAPAVVGVAAAAAAAGLLGLVSGLVMIYARADQVVAGTAATLLAVGITGTVWAALQHAGHDTLPAGAGIEPWLAGQHVLTWLVPVLVIGTAVLLARMRIGLVITALGEDPDACAAAGIRVRLWRLTAVVVAAGLAGVAGAWLSLMRTHGFQPLMSGGKGFVVLALVILGRWRPVPVALACVGFALVEAVQQTMQAQGAGAQVSWRLLDLLPWLAALAALMVAGRSARSPAALGRAW